MTPKEKATQLVDRFSSVGLQMREEGLKCALIYTEETLILLSDFIDDNYGQEHLFNSKIEYWKEVKIEIEQI